MLLKRQLVKIRITMKLNRLQRFGTAAAIILLASPLARAGQASGSYTNVFPTNAVSLPLWDISGFYTGSYTVKKVYVKYAFDLTNSPAGECNGAGSVEIDYDGNLLGGTMKVGGKVESADTAPRVVLSFSTTITNLAGAKGTMTLDYELDSTEGVLLVTGGSASLRATIDGKKVSDRESIPKGEEETLPTDVTGGWKLDLTLTPSSGENYSADSSATITTSTGATVDFTVTGTYDHNKDTSEIVLKNDSGELTLVVSTSGSTLTVNSAKGKLFGQTINYKAS
jgi:hypothetical protein